MDYHSTGCLVCGEESAQLPPFTFAFQPIVNLSSRTLFAYEALVRGPKGEGAATILAQIDDQNRHLFDQQARCVSIRLAHRLGLMRMEGVRLSINFMPSAVYEPSRCLRSTLAVVHQLGFDPARLIFEVLESDQIAQPQKVQEIFDYYADQGFWTAVDDFGAGYAGLSLLIHLKPKLIKLDRDLVWGVDAHPIKQTLIRSVLQMTRELGIEVLAEGVERDEEARWLFEAGIVLQQGYYFARPAFEHLASDCEVYWPVWSGKASE